jgi:fructose-1-phosphate kinase PfkB-like protein
VKQVLVKMGENGSVLVRDQEPPLFQPAILASRVVDTTGAGDTFTAAYAVAVIERQTPEEALRFAGTFFSLWFFFCMDFQQAIYSNVCTCMSMCLILPPSLLP